MAFASCSHYEQGYYTAYRRMAEDRPDLILHLGDYIYEGGAGTSGVRQHAGQRDRVAGRLPPPVRAVPRYPDLQAAHAIAPWLVVPDDHEVENNYANMVRADNSPALTTAQWTARRTAAYQAYFENMPLRAARTPSGNSIPLYRRVRWGTLATFHMLDTRQFRDDQACGDGSKVCADADLATRTITGAAQEAWLLDGFAQHLGTWDIIGQQVFFARQFNSTGAEHGRLGRLPRLPGPDPAGLGRPRPCATRSCSPATCTAPGPTTSRPTTPTRVGDHRHRAGLHARSPPAATATAPPRSPTGDQPAPAASTPTGAATCGPDQPDPDHAPTSGRWPR